MKENTRTWLLAVGAPALLAFAGFVYHMHPGIIGRIGIKGDDLGEGAVAALVLWLVLRQRRPMTPRTRVVLGTAAAAGLLVGLAVFFIS